MNVFGRRAAAAADDARAHGGCFSRKKREIFGRRSRIDDAIADALGKSGVGHSRNGTPGRGQTFENRQQRLRAERAIRADHLNILLRQARRCFRWADATEGVAFFGKRKLGHDRQRREGANRIDRRQQHI